MLAGEEYIELSPAAVACPVNDFRNVGNWAPKAIATTRSMGATVEMWPQAAIDPRYDNDKTQAIREKHRVPTGWTCHETILTT